MEILSERELLNLTGGRLMTWCEMLVVSANIAEDWTDEDWDKWAFAFEHCA